MPGKRQDYMDFEYDEEEYRIKRQQNPNLRNTPGAVPQNRNAANQYRYLSQQNRQRTEGRQGQPMPQRPPQRPGQAPVDGRMRYEDRMAQGQGHRPVREISSPEGEERKKKKKKKSPLKIIRNVLIILLVVYIALFTGVFAMVSGLDYKKQDRGTNEYVDSSSLKSSSRVINILFIGVDQREDEESRSDTMMLISSDKKNKKIKITSFMRDTFLTVPGQGDMRLNAACFYGGPKLVMDTIEYNFRIEIDHYMMVNFEAFKKVIDSIGGVDVNITADEAEYLRNTVKIPYIVEGHNHLNGGATLWYCRIRYLDSDFQRTERQRQVVSSIVKAAASQGPFKLLDTVKEAMPYIETDMSPMKLTFLMQGALLRYMHYDIEQQRVPYGDYWESDTIDGQSVLTIDVDATAQRLQNYIYG